MNRVSQLVVVVGLVAGGASLAAQDPASEVRKVFDAQFAAAKAQDAKAYAGFVADELRWVGSDGAITTKQERLKAMVGPGVGPPAVADVDVKVHGDSATVVATTTSPTGKGRLVRTYVKRDGRWQMVMHATVPMK